MTRRPATTLALVASGTFMVTFDGAAVQMALPVLRRDLAAPIGDIHWAMTGYLLTSTVALLPAGRLGDAYGRDRVWRAGILVFALASAVAALAPSLPWLIAARVAQGVGAALVTAEAAALLADAFPERRGLALGAGNIAIGLGLVTGPPLGAVLTKFVSWRLLFAPVFAVGLLAFLASRGRLPRAPRSRRSIDAAGGVLSALGLSALLVGTTEGHRWGWGSAAVLITIAASVALLAGFALRERTAREPLLGRGLFHNRWFISGALTALFGFMSLFTVTQAIPFFLVIGQGRGLVKTGLIACVVPLGLATGAPLAGWATDRIGSRGIAAGGLTLVAASLITIAWAGQQASTGLLLVALGVTGFGMGCFEAPSLSTSLATLPQERLGIGTATLGVMRNLGMTIGTAAAATLLAWRMDTPGDSAARRAVQGAQAALLVGAGAAIAGALAALIRPSGRPRRRPGPLREGGAVIA